MSGAVPWGEFIARHAATLWACDFMSVRTWTLRGRVDLYLLIFIHVSSRRGFVSPATVSPDPIVHVAYRVTRFLNRTGSASA